MGGRASGPVGRTIVFVVGFALVAGCSGQDQGAELTARTRVDRSGRAQDLAGPTLCRPRTPGHPRLSPVLRRLVRARVGGDRQAERDLLEQYEGVIAPDGRLMIQIGRPGLDLAHAALPSGQLLARFGADVRSRGADVLDAWIPVEQLSNLAEALPPSARIRLPRPPRRTLGAVVTEGVALTGASDCHCPGVTGAGVHVAVIDLGFDGRGAAAKELGTLASTPSAGGGKHGTSCAEIIFDMAPGVTVHPVKIASLADVQQFGATIQGTKIAVVSESLVWTGHSFVDGTAPHCKVVDQASKAGAVWITSAGNHGGGAFYSGAFTDADNDGRHEFAPGDELNEITLKKGWSTRIDLDWDAFPETAEDYDLQLYRRETGGSWTLVKSSTIAQDGATPPAETLWHKAAAAATFGVAVVRKQASKPKMKLRIYAFPAPGIQLEHWSRDSSLLVPAACKGIVAVGAASHTKFAAGGIADFSSRGPTVDGRIKPDVVAPTNIETRSAGVATGTSAAAPHVSGALALYIEATGQGAAAAAQAVLADARPRGAMTPNNTHGHGMLKVHAATCGWQCKPQQSGACTTSCGSVGAGTCGTTCRLDSCQPPAETCNGKDDDCDGRPDNGFACASGAKATCTTSCGSTGTRTCTESCSWPGSCQPPAELCNGEDDDCDGEVDEISDCQRPSGGCAFARGAPHLILVWLLLFAPLATRRLGRPRS